jgi:hypothetical protein
MQFRVQVVTRTEQGEESIREVACVERQELTPASLGLAIADSKAILQGLQEVVVEWQMRTYLDAQRYCPCRALAGAYHSGVALSRNQMGVLGFLWHQCQAVARCAALR